MANARVIPTKGQKTGKQVPQKKRKKAQETGRKPAKKGY